MQTTLDYSFTEFPAFRDKDVEIHKGTGNHAYDPWLVQWSTVDDVSKPLGFEVKHCEVVVMCLTIRTSDAPNWYGDRLPAGYSVVCIGSKNVFFHPSPGNAGMTDDAYQSRTGLWRRSFDMLRILAFSSMRVVAISSFLFHSSITRYRLHRLPICSALEGIVAVALSGAQRLFIEGWKIYGLPDVEKGSSLSPEASDVVLSCFSYGRQSDQSVRQRMPGLKTCLREIWDFDDTGCRQTRQVTAKLKVISYDQQDSVFARAFHVPLRRWSGFSPFKDPPRILDGFIPSMLMWHAAEVSDVANTHHSKSTGTSNANFA